MRAMLEAQAPQISLRMAQTGLSLVKERSIRDGISVEGAYAEYSDKPVYKSAFKKKALNSAGSAYASSGGKGTWGDFRAAQGRPSHHVNAFYTGRMWSSLAIVAQSQNGHRYSVLTGSNDADAAAVLLANLKRYGTFLKLRTEEINRVQQDADLDVTDIVNQFL